MRFFRFSRLLKLTITGLAVILWVEVVQAQTQTQTQTQQLTPANFSVGHAERLLVLAPHPDDETLSAGGLIQQVLAQGGSVRTVVVTSGDAYVEAIEKATGKQQLKPRDFIHYGEERLNESRHAAQLLGKGFIHLDLMGYSDGSVYAMLVSHWRRSHPDRSGFTGFDHVPYHAAEDKGTAQDGEDLRNELVAILKDTKPTIIVFPDVMENDSDHAGLGMFTLLAVDDWREINKTSSKQPQLLAYLIHWQDGWPLGSTADKAVDSSEQPLFLPDNLPLRGHSRSCVELNQPEVKLKAQALQLYKTQQQAMGPFLQAFVHSNECFTQFKVADTKGIENIVKQWQHARKQFDSHPVSRWRIAME